jgi:hypothetical protein
MGGPLLDSSMLGLWEDDPLVFDCKRGASANLVFGRVKMILVVYAVLTMIRLIFY